MLIDVCDCSYTAFVHMIFDILIESARVFSSFICNHAALVACKLISILFPETLHYLRKAALFWVAEIFHHLDMAIIVLLAIYVI